MRVFVNLFIRSLVASFACQQYVSTCKESNTSNEYSMSVGNVLLNFKISNALCAELFTQFLGVNLLQYCTRLSNV